MPFAKLLESDVKFLSSSAKYQPAKRSTFLVGLKFWSLSSVDLASQARDILSLYPSSQIESYMQTNKSAYFVISTLVEGQFSMAPERIIAIGAIKYVGLSSLRDDWVAFVLGSRTEPDVFFSCIFKTELVTRLQLLLRGLDIRIGPRHVFCVFRN